MKPVNPATLSAPRGYNNGMVSEGGRILFVAGQVGWNSGERMAEGLVAQFDQALYNILEVVTAAGGGAESIGRFTIYIKDKHEYVALRKELGAAYRKRMGRHYPAMSLVVVSDLLEEQARIEIEATAVIS
jgi:enamine deaminase RidA (YjgF/YER057c/UK114 family)